MRVQNSQAEGQAAAVRASPWPLAALLFLGLLVVLPVGCRDNIQIKGHSMEPTLKEGDRLTAYYPYSNRNPERQDIVLFDYHGEKRVSRIIGLPGDTIEIRDGMVYVNDTRLEEPYLASGTRTQSATARFHVPADSYFVMGDNRGQSNDSRAIGPILQAQIFGKVVQ